MADPAGDRPLTDNPCVGICRLGTDGLCTGCRRSGAEIRAWYDLPAAERDRINRRILPDAHPAVQIRLTGHRTTRGQRRGGHAARVRGDRER